MMCLIGEARRPSDHHRPILELGADTRLGLGEPVGQLGLGGQRLVRRQILGVREQRLQLGPARPALADLLAGGLPVLAVLDQGRALAELDDAQLAPQL
ncbi:hypothetical protein [Lamprobacter modestohalophilus]|uniref:hypothetical protein n=1 Tax=Lamprobacter modestohalophilus TaxID=1064514 RepID=UPI0019033605|nr:hypothetical protein [Lamprobacter modestohalophilus]